MSNRKRPQAYRLSQEPQDRSESDTAADETSRTIELREEQLVAHKELREMGSIQVRTQIDEVPGHLEVEAYREEVVVEHEAVGQVVSEREKPWEEDDVLVVPIYEEQLVVTKRLVLRERMRVRRVATTVRQLYQDTLRRDRLVVEDPQDTGLVHEQYPVDDPEGSPDDESSDSSTPGQSESSFLGNLVRKALE